MAEIREALKSPLKDDRWAAKVALGGVFPLISVLSFISMIMTAAFGARMSGHWFTGAITGFAAAFSGAVFVLSPVLNFFPFGYIVAQARKVRAGGGNKLPEWENWKKLFVDGVLYFLVYLVYLLIPLLLIVWSILYPAGGVGEAVARYMTAMLSFILGLGAAFMIPMAICNFVAKSSFFAAFDFNVIMEKIKTAGKDYASAYAASLGIFLAIYLISLFLGVLVIGWIMFPFLMFYANIALAKLFMEIYPENAAGRVTGTEPAGGENRLE